MPCALCPEPCTLSPVLCVRLWCSFVIFNTPFDVKNVAGMLLALVGMILYTHIKMNAPKPAPAPAPAETVPLKAGEVNK